MPSGAEPYGGANGPCAELAELKPARVVYGPATFLNQAATSIQDAFYGTIRSASARAAREKAARDRGRQKSRQERC